jgi:hypothetical protein
MRAPSKIFSCKPVLARMQRLAAGGGATVGIVACSSGGQQSENGGLATFRYLVFTSKLLMLVVSAIFLFSFVYALRQQR